MDAQGWNERYAKTDRVSTEPNPLVVELASPSLRDEHSTSPPARDATPSGSRIAAGM